MTTVRLTMAELLQAAQVGIMRRVQNIKLGRVERPAGNSVGREGAWSRDIEGAAGEMAVAKWRRTYWSGAIGDITAADVGQIQVRTTTHPAGKLILHEYDDREASYVLVRGVAPDFELVGWCIGVDGMLPDYWQDPTGKRPAFFVPANALRPMSEQA